MTVVLIMAGGKSSRMRESGNACHKALREVGGVSLIERNLTQVLAAGIRDVFVAVSVGEESIQQFVAQRGQDLAHQANASIHLLVEQEPLGTIGIAGQLASLAQEVLVLNVDNLTTLCLRSFVQHHHDNAAAMTIATHIEHFRIPLGEVVVTDDQITAYREKPNHPVRISSGAYVLASRTCSWIEPQQRTDIPALIPLLQAKNESILAFKHSSHWIDINDDDSLARAEQLVGQNKQEFTNDFLLC